MGYAFIIFVVLLASALVIATGAVYGVVKDSQKAPLRALNDYANIKTDQAQTGITIVNTCLSGNGAYVTTSNGAGPYTLWLTVKNNGSTVLNPYKSTVLYNSSYSSFSVTTGVGSSVPFGQVWTPLNNTTMSVPNILIYNLNYPYRLMIAAPNGITAIAPTTPTNFSGQSDKSNTTYDFNWSASTDDKGIAYYLVYDLKQPGSCPLSQLQYIFQIQGNATSSDLSYSYACPNPPCQNTYFFITAVDTEGNMGIPSVVLNCNPPTSGQLCKNTGNPYG